MYFEEIKRQPPKMGKQQQLVQSERQERHKRKTSRGQTNREENPQRSEREGHDARTEEYGLSAADDQGEHATMDDVGRKKQIQERKHKLAS